MRWFRMYGEMPDDPKVGTLTDSEFRTWVELLCLACREERDGTTSATEDNASWLLRRNVTEPLQKLLHRGLIRLDDDGFVVISKWEGRQKASDSAKERVRKFRRKQKCNVTETAPLRDGNGVEKNRVEKKERVALSDLSTEMFREYCRRHGLVCDVGLELEKFTQYCLSGKGKYVDHVAAFNGWLLRTKGKGYENTTRYDAVNKPGKSERARAAILQSARDLGYAD